MGEYDRGVAIVHIRTMLHCSSSDDAVTGVRLRIDDVWQARRSPSNYESPKGRFRVLNWTDYHRNSCGAEDEKRMTGVLLFFIVVIAAFNIVSTLVMMVVDASRVTSPF